jgi:hypothetical protein
MARTMVMVVALAFPLLTGCKGMYVAGDGGAHGDWFNAPPSVDHRSPDETSPKLP